jgi:branched-chain amino acid transport system substrate-binding protein
LKDRKKHDTSILIKIFESVMKFLFLSCFALASILIVLQSCSDDSSTTPSSPVAVPVALVYARTGQQTDLGESILYGATLAAEEINTANALPGMILRLTAIDDQSSITGAQLAFRTAVDTVRAVAVLGPTTSTLAFAADSIAVAAGISVLAVSNSAEGITGIGPSVFRVGLPESVIIPAIVNTTQPVLGYTSCAIVYTMDDSYSMNAKALFEEALTKKGVSIPVKIPITLASTEFSEAVNNIAAANVQAIILCTQLNEGARFMIEARGLGIPQSVPFIASSGIGGTNIAGVAGSAAEGLISGSGWLDKLQTPDNAGFVSRYTSRFGKAPTSTSAQSFAAICILANALKSVKSVSASSLREKLAQTTAFQTILGNITYTASSREPGYTPVIKVLHNGVFELFN